MSNRSRSLWLALLASLGVATPAHAQALSFLTGVFSNITDINAFYVIGEPLDDAEEVQADRSNGLRGIGFEVSFDLGTLLPLSEECPSPPTPIKEIQTHVRGANGKDSLVIITQPKPPKQDCEQYGLFGELAFGYSQVGRFRGRDATLGAGIEELPFVTLYGSVANPTLITPYGGIRGGLVQLKDLRLSVDTLTIKGSASTFEYGLVAGLSAAVSDNASVFFEAAWTYRTFDAVDWASSPAAIPPALRRPLNMSTRTFSFGGQLVFKKPS